MCGWWFREGGKLTLSGLGFCQVNPMEGERSKRLDGYAKGDCRAELGNKGGRAGK